MGGRRPAGIMAAAKQAFLKSFAVSGIISDACAKVGISRNSVYVWLESDEQFTLAYHQAEQSAIEHLEREAFRRAVEGSPQARTTYWHGQPVGVDEKIEY